MHTIASPFDPFQSGRLSAPQRPVKATGPIATLFAEYRALDGAACSADVSKSILDRMSEIEDLIALTQSATIEEAHAKAELLAHFWHEGIEPTRDSPCVSLAAGLARDLERLSRTKDA